MVTDEREAGRSFRFHCCDVYMLIRSVRIANFCEKVDALHRHTGVVGAAAARAGR